MSQDTALFVTDENQKLASDPEASAWVSANAGTGKTAVLVRRVPALHAGAGRKNSLPYLHRRTRPPRWRTGCSKNWPVSDRA
jgi:ATP-dependent exoDNAse (exonuclease V) beta subunit